MYSYYVKEIVINIHVKLNNKLRNDYYQGWGGGDGEIQVKPDIVKISL